MIYFVLNDLVIFFWQFLQFTQLNTSLWTEHDGKYDC